MDYSKFHNPYDFANPIADADLFIGRKQEMEDIKYYLDHAQTAPKPINIAILGPRASGKTSVLNMTEFEANKRSFCTVRIDLDEGDIKTHLGFFYKLFDSIFSKACECGAFGGKDSKTYDVYLDMVNTYRIPEEKLFCPVLFPIQYAKALSVGNVDAQVSDFNYRNDINKIREQINRPIVILFDEGNVLANSRILLEKIRNYFMNSTGFMIVLTGTPDLFPVMDVVFSPIIRQFKKIIIGDFKDTKETKECIKKPLEKIGLDPDALFDFQSLRDIEEIHDLSGGRPYEIQLICHKLFQRVQLQKAKKMRLDWAVLEDVRKELETSQDISSRPILSKIKSLQKKQVAALRLLCACDGRASFEQIWQIEYIFRDELSWSKESLKKAFEYFVENKIVLEDQGLIKFAGDDFDKIYTKYYAREQGLSLAIGNLTIEALWNSRMGAYFKGLKDGKNIVRLQLDNEIDFDQAVRGLADEEKAQDIFATAPPWILDIYFVMIKYRNEKEIPFIAMDVSLPWFKACSWFYPKSPKGNFEINELERNFKDLKDRVNKSSGKFTVDVRTIAVISTDILFRKIKTTENSLARRIAVDFHLFQMFEEYLNRKDSEEAFFYAKLASELCDDISPGDCNNMGYVFMNKGELTGARELFEKSISKYAEEQEKALPYYNLGILEGKLGNPKQSLEKITLSLRALNNKNYECGCLFIPKIKGKKLIFEEVREKPNLLEIANEAKRVIEINLDETKEMKQT